MKIIAGTIVAASLLLSACSTTTYSNLNAETQPVAGMGYIGGEFVSQKSNFNPTLVLIRQGTQEEIPVHFSTALPTELRHTEVGLMRLQPGRYKVKGWVPMAGNNDRVVGKVFSDTLFQKEIEIRADTVVYLGKFFTTSKWTPSYPQEVISVRVEAEKLSTENAHNKLSQEFPKLAAYNFDCLLCAK
ncbi:hypothetical protein [Undibacterium curvum]|uniref:DUF2846 domain-containing protein n=1 Tax=Undibacterium curvum TaxID=2762294 RepID=A0ABR7A5I6_9BURK|nr:hypothetical protein [Undibacterium curvum]MBC3932161.1 hypothetical protein [Undibacterium curvum]